jgi:hypothetical protein
MHIHSGNHSLSTGTTIRKKNMTSVENTLDDELREGDVELDMLL